MRTENPQERRAARPSVSGYPGSHAVPDKRKHRGRHPDDERLFAPERVVALQTSVREFSWLLSHGYAEPSALKLVGDRHRLTVRQRAAVRRSACSDAARTARAQRRLEPLALRDATLAIDGYNLLITLETAMSGGLVFIGRDGCVRDLAGVHGTYRKVTETIPAVEFIVAGVERVGCRRVDWYLDRPVSNSGRLRELIQKVLTSRPMPPTETIWQVETVESPDRTLLSFCGIVATCDSVILDRCGPWVNLAGELIAAHVPDAWIIDLGSEAQR